MDKNVQELFDDLTKDLGFMYSGANEYYNNYLELFAEKKQATPISEILRSQNSEWRDKIECHLKVLSDIEEEKRKELEKQKEKSEKLKKREDAVKEREDAVKKREDAVANEENKDNIISQLRETNAYLDEEIGKKNKTIEENITNIKEMQFEIIKINKMKENSSDIESMISLTEVKENYNLKSESVLKNEYDALSTICKQYRTKHNNSIF